MSDFGSVGFGTIDPGNGTLEEQISWTGLTQNANGTATLTGVKNVLFAYPYTQATGLFKTHAGATTFVVSNTSGFYNQFVAKGDDGTIAETLTFTNPLYPRMDTQTPAPTDPQQLVTKAYADSLAISGAPNASTSVQGLVQIATQAQIDAKTIIGSTSAYLVQPLDTQRSTLLSDYVIDTSGSPNVIVITPSPAISAYAAGQEFSFKIANTNTSPTVTINVNGVGAQNIIFAGASPSVGDLTSGQVIGVEYDGTNFQVLSGTTHNSTPTGAITMFAGSAAPTNWLICNGSPVSRTTYASLFSVISTTYGAGDASTTFNVPDMRGRIAVGAGTGTGGGASGSGLPTGGSALTTRSLGGWVGEETHTLTTAEIASHHHLTVAGATTAGSTGGSSGIAPGTGLSAATNTGDTGGDGAHNNIQPMMTLNYIIHV